MAAAGIMAWENRPGVFGVKPVYSQTGYAVERVESKQGYVEDRINPRYAVALAWGTIDTFEVAARRIESGEARAAFATDVTAPANVMTARGVLPYLVQFRHVVTAEERARLEKLGARVIGYVPHNTLLVEAGPERLREVAGDEGVQWMGEYKPEYKLSPGLRGAVRGVGGTNAVDVRVYVFDESDVGRVMEAIERAGGVVTGFEPSGVMVAARLTYGQCEEVARSAGVRWIELAPRYKMCNNVVVGPALMNVRTVWETLGLSGAGEIIGHCDTGLDTGNLSTLHPDFTGRVVKTYALGRSTWSDNVGHGTHTAGSLLGDGSASTGEYRGVAYGAMLVHQSVADSYGQLTGIPTNLYTLFTPPYNDGARIHSDSWGSSANLSGYTADSRVVDQFAWDRKDMLIVFSAGNESVDGDYDGMSDWMKITPPGTAKNVLTVGASESIRPPGSGGYSSRIYGTGDWEPYYPLNPIHDDLFSSSGDGFHHGMAAFSSRGPCLDGRIKPDVVAPGTDIISCRASGVAANAYWGIVNTRYAFLGGSSMATPLVAGSAALVRQYLREQYVPAITNPSAALVKAILINGARTLTPGQYGWGEWREIPAARPNAVEGWGHVDLGASLSNITVYEHTGLATAETATYFVVLAETSSVAITLVWTDYPSVESAAINLVNDLDLRVEEPDGTVVFPNGGTAADRRNNVEAVYRERVAAGTCTVTVVAHNVPYGPQPFALVARSAAVVERAHRIDMYTQRPQTNAVTPASEVLVSAWVATNGSGIAGVTLHYEPLPGAPQSVPMAVAGGFDFGLQFTNAIPAMPLGTSVKWYVTAEANDGATGTSAVVEYTVQECIVYVATDGTQQEPYNTWATACTNLQTAINYAKNGWTILVTNGVYYNMERATTYWGRVYIPEVLVNKEVTIRSVNGPDYTVLDNRNIFRVLTIIARNAVVEGFTIQRGYAFDIGGQGGMAGGGVYMLSGVLRNCDVRWNAVSALGAYGGGVAMEGQSLVDGCRIRDNAAYGGFAGYGGGLYMDKGSVARSTVVHGNYAPHLGGGVRVSFAALTNCTVAGNTASSYPASGGVYVYRDAVLNNCIVYGNSGGNYDLRNDGQTSTPRYVWTYCYVTPVPSGANVISISNSASDPRFVSPANDDYHLAANSPCRNAGQMADWMAGAVDADGRARVRNASVDVGAYETGPLSVSFSGTPTRGFVIPLRVYFTAYPSGDDTNTAVYFWDFENDGTDDQVGLGLRTPTNTYSEGVYTVRLIATNASGDRAYWRRDAYIYAYGSNVLFVATNGAHQAPFTSWAAAATNIEEALNWALDGCTVMVSNGHYRLASRIDMSKAVTLRSESGPQRCILDGQGVRPVLYIGHSSAVVDGFTITNGYSGTWGGGVHFAAQGTVRNCWIVRNRAEYYGSGVYLYRAGTLQNCRITHNYGATYGSGIYVHTGSGMTLLDSIITDNSGYVGDAIYSRSPVTVRNCLIARNTSSATSVLVHEQGATLESCTIVDNVVNDLGLQGGAAVWAPNSTLRNNIIRFNTCRGGESNIWPRPGLTVTYTCTWPPWTGVGNTSVDPRFRNRAGRDYRLGLDSYCVNAGQNQSWHTGAFDLEGNPRRVNGTVDMGAYELNTNIPLLRVSTFVLNVGTAGLDEVITRSFVVSNVGGSVLEGYVTPPAAPFYLAGATNYAVAVNSGASIPVGFQPTAIGIYSSAVVCVGGGDATVSVQGLAVPEAGVWGFLALLGAAAGGWRRKQIT